MNTVYQSYYKSPLGIIEVISDTSAIISVKALPDNAVCTPSKEIPKVLNDCIKQLDEYFSGKRTNFELPLSQTGTSFQKQVWETLEAIPFGETISYKTLAERCHSPKACRAVGSANGKNQHWIIVPCHRVITNDGKLGGYAGGLWRKEWLLEHEKQSK